MRHSHIAAAITSAIVLPLLAACASTPFIATGSPGTAGPRSDTAFAQVARGMSEGEVQGLLGRPDETMRFPLSQSAAWDNRYYDPGGHPPIYSVTFGPDRHVVSTISNRINSGSDPSGK